MTVVAERLKIFTAPASAGRVAVIDIGSNSIRLVVFDGLTRAPVSIFNEKIMCGLGRGLERTGCLNPDGVRLALDNLGRFAELAKAMQVTRCDVLATAAVRDASDGRAFVNEVQQRTDLSIKIVDGEGEARLSALGVLSGKPDADGVAGDLGGGSIELIGLDKGTLGPRSTLPLGPLRLMEAGGGHSDKVARVIERQLKQCGWLDAYSGRPFHAVGGSWRALAKLHIEQTKYPLHIVHQYTLDRDAAASFVSMIVRQDKAALEKMPGMQKRRADTLPYAALVLEQVIHTLKPSSVVFSAYGLREGHLYDLLPEADKKKDPLLDACAAFAVRVGRFGEGEAIAAWTASLFPNEAPAETRLREAACLVSDIGWPEHPDYRAEHGFLRILRMPFAGIDHHDRARLALAIYARYEGRFDQSLTASARAILSPAEIDYALVLGLALRLGHALTGGTPNLLRRTRLVRTENQVELILPKDLPALMGDTVSRRLEALAKALGAVGVVR